MANNNKLAVIAEEYPYKHCLTTLTFDSELKRVAEERSEQIGITISKLSTLSGVGGKQIYNYRMGKTPIPEASLLAFCKHFASTAIISAWLAENEVCEVPDGFDLVRVTNKSAQQFLKTHEAFMTAFDDGKIDGFEMIELEKSTATSIASVNNLRHIARMSFQKKKVA
jgi:hypothetical protein